MTEKFNWWCSIRRVTSTCSASELFFFFHLRLLSCYLLYCSCSLLHLHSFIFSHSFSFALRSIPLLSLSLLNFPFLLSFTFLSFLYLLFFFSFSLIISPSLFPLFFSSLISSSPTSWPLRDPWPLLRDVTWPRCYRPPQPPLPRTPRLGVPALHASCFSSFHRLACVVNVWCRH